MTYVSRRGVLSAAAVGALAHPALAQDFPNRLVQLIVPFAAGGGTDIVARYFAAAAGRAGVAMQVNPMPGGGGARGGRQVLQAAPDGYTLLFGTMGSNVITPMMNDIGFHPDSFDTIAIVAAASHIFCVGAQSTIHTLADLRRQAREKNLSYSSAGAGSLGHVAMELFSRKTGLEFLHVPYNGSAEALNAVLGQHVDMTLPTTGSAMPTITSGYIRALAITSDTRSAEAPDVPTVREAGVDLLVLNWRGIFAPKNTPAPIRAFLTDLCRRIVAEPEFAALSTRTEGEPPIFRDSASFARQIDEETKQYQDIVASMRRR
ncbi:tripartite-type tricarboxylate transporter receptor subunit TctC [Humitalea rosea]|uniref:Tripartite-type tricarboxylate transporter receptor subunit TctC n=1 Tax=Humitalea rosea TaxID=990373 RepID=A0A2W7IVV9_9PROT|nr:tripartite tricarboxylate transporter substrate binding protein [Humitalea rosea]PZW50898.1 tripartite-type tricarboxylate transporter receptor subunit TctC [Humitalea rosea]